jgi:hypothetical protein
LKGNHDSFQIDCSRTMTEYQDYKKSLLCYIRFNHARSVLKNGSNVLQSKCVHLARLLSILPIDNSLNPVKSTRGVLQRANWAGQISEVVSWWWTLVMSKDVLYLFFIHTVRLNSSHRQLPQSRSHSSFWTHPICFSMHYSRFHISNTFIVSSQTSNLP